MRKAAEIEFELYRNALRISALENKAEHCEPWSVEFDNCLSDIQRIQKQNQNLSIELLQARTVEVKSMGNS